MKRPITVLLISMLGLLSLAPLPADASWRWNHCGSQHHLGAGWYNVRSHNVGCQKARRVARKWWNNGGPRHVWVAGWRYRCRSKQTAYEGGRTRCTAHGWRVVKFQWGS